MVYDGELLKKGGTILGQNQLNRLQMVQFECPKDGNPCVSFTFGEFPFSAPDCSFLALSGVIRKGLLWGAG